MSDLQDLERRLQMLEDERAILTTLAEYGHSIDYGLTEKFAGLFTEDAVYHVSLLQSPEVCEFRLDCPEGNYISTSEGL